MSSEFSYDEISKILLEKKSKFLVDQSLSTTKDNSEMVLSISKNIEDLGFVLSKELFDALKYQPQNQLIDSYELIVRVLTRMIGAHTVHQPFYKNFPQQVASLSDLDLYMNALVHYWLDGQWIPEYISQLRFPMEDGNFQIHTISLGSISEFHQIFIDMLSSRGSLAAYDQELLGWYIQNADDDDLLKRLPETIPTKETMSLLLGKIMEFHPGKHELVNKYVKTATDVLRLITSLSGGDISLAGNTRFRNFSRPERRLLLSLLNNCSYLEEDMGRFPEKWLRVGEKLHPGEYSSQFPAAYEAFRKTRKGEKTYSFAGDLERALKVGDFEETLRLLRQRPGELARRMDSLARSFPENQEDLLNAFETVAGKTSSQVLLQLMAHFKARNEEVATRSFFPKGNIAKVQVVENPLPPLSAEFCTQIVHICEVALIHQFSAKPALGKVWINPVLKKIFVPIAQRSSSRSFKTYARGSRFTLPEDVKTIRGFIHWKNVTISIAPGSYWYEEDDYSEEPLVLSDDFVEEFGISPAENIAISDWRGVLSERDNTEAGTINQRMDTIRQERTDIDLSLGLYNAEWEFIEQISYTNLRSKQLGLFHSGDIVDAPQGASEFIDMDIEKLKENGVRYAVFNVYSYSQQGFNETPECFFGWMTREKPASGEIFEPKTVANKIDLTSPTIICLPVLFDFEKLEVIWMDVSLRSNPNWVNNIEANRNNVVLISKAINELKKPNLFDLLRLNVLARGELMDTPENADLRFGVDEEEDVTPFDTEVILSEYM